MPQSCNSSCYHHCQELAWNLLTSDPSLFLRRCGKNDRRGCKYTPMTQEELAEPLTPRSPTTVSNSPDVGQPLWHPLLADSEHAYAWWMLSKQEMQIVLADLQSKADNRATSRMTGSNPKQQVAINAT